MTTTKEAENLAADEEDAPEIGTLLLRSAPTQRERVAVKALVEEDRILARDNVRSALVVKEGGAMTCRWEGLSGRLYTLGLDEQERAFLGLVLSMVGIGHITIAVVEDLDERRLKIVLRAVTQLAGNNTIAVGTRI